MIEELKSKTLPESKEQVWLAWNRIKQSGKGVGVDNVTIEMIERNPRKYLYPLWNRLASGSYFPPPVKEVLIPKGKFNTRILGVPTILDKVAQEVIRVELEKTVEPFDTEVFDYGDCFNVQNGNFTAPIAGVYHFHTNLAFRN